MAFNSQYGNHNAMYAGANYSALNGIAYAGSVTEGVTGSDGSSCAATFHASTAEGVSGGYAPAVVGAYSASLAKSISASDHTAAFTPKPTPNLRIFPINQENRTSS